MGLTNQSVGRAAIDGGLHIKKQAPSDIIVALAGNPNVGKSTVFNALTGLRQHTGNWPGKTVTNAVGYAERNGQGYELVDLPGCYSLMAHSAEETVARDFICFGEPDAVIVVCDATCLERNLNVALQILEITPRVVVCVNLMDEAAKKHIDVDLKGLEEILGVPVIGTAARSGKGMDTLLDAVRRVAYSPPGAVYTPKYTKEAEGLIERTKPHIAVFSEKMCLRFLAMRLYDSDELLLEKAAQYAEKPLPDKALRETLLAECKAKPAEIRDDFAKGTVLAAEIISREVIGKPKTDYTARDRKIDKILTGKLWGFPVMFLLVMGIFWLTIVGANYPSQWLSTLLFGFEDTLAAMLAGAPVWLVDMLVHGAYRVTAWVVSVMLPPMAIFFPLFTLLEDLGYLPRVAFNLDKCFKKCRACGKQALTMR